MTTVAVIIPTYNRWPTVCAAIDSVLAQSYPHTRCLVVDDASTDDTVAKLRQHYGDRIDLVENRENRGQSCRRNQGARASTADYICFLDSDDVFDRDSVKSRMEVVATAPAAIRACFGLFRKAGRHSNPLLTQKQRGDTLCAEEYVQNMNWLCNNSFLIHRETFLADGLYNEKLRNREDIELLIRLLSKHPFYFCGEEIGQIRDLCSNRARDNYDNILDPANSFAHFIQANPIIRSALKPETIASLIATEVEEQLRALYRLERFAEFRQLFRQASRHQQIRHRGKFAKRYWLSFLLGLLVRNPLLREAEQEIYHSERYGSRRTPAEKVVFDSDLSDFCSEHDVLCDRFDALIAQGYCYKSDGTSTVARTTLPGRHWVIKRYNSKGLATTLKLLARASRAERAFIKGLILRRLGINTPKPLIFAVRYEKGLPHNCYIVTEQSEGDTVCNLYDRGVVSREEWPLVVAKLRAILDTLHSRAITHGDIKAPNILLKDGEVEIIDLDSLRIHWNDQIFNHFRAKDLRALETRIGGYIDRDSKPRQ